MPKEINTMSPQFDKLNNKNNTNNAVSRLIINNLIISNNFYFPSSHNKLSQRLLKKNIFSSQKNIQACAR